MSETKDETTRTIFATSGRVASGVAVELVQPMRELRDSLARIVKALDAHIGGASGPTPLSWGATKELRENVAEAYLASRNVTRLTSDLAHAIDNHDSVPEEADLNELLEVAINLTRHTISVDTEVFIDLGTLPHVKVVPGRLVLFLSRLIALSADSARRVEAGAISLKTRREELDESNAVVVVHIADNGAGIGGDTSDIAELAALVLEPLGGSCEATTEAGAGGVFELRIPIRR